MKKVQDCDKFRYFILLIVSLIGVIPGALISRLSGIDFFNDYGFFVGYLVSLAPVFVLWFYLQEKYSSWLIKEEKTLELENE